MVEAGRGDLLQRRERVARGGGVGRVRFHQHHRVLAALQAAREILRHVEDELHVPERDEAVRLVDGGGCRDDLEVAGILERAHERARERARLRADDGGRQRLRVHVDGIAEEDELHHRHADHHREGEAVTPHLDEFLHQHCQKPVQCKHGLQASGRADSPTPRM
jgi:hypothetical protein